MQSWMRPWESITQLCHTMRQARLWWETVASKENAPRARAPSIQAPQCGQRAVIPLGVACDSGLGGSGADGAAPPPAPPPPALPLSCVMKPVAPQAQFDRLSYSLTDCHRKQTSEEPEAARFEAE